MYNLLRKCEITFTYYYCRTGLQVTFLLAQMRRSLKMYKRHSSLVKHLSFGQCKMILERHTLFDLAKTKYHARLVEGASVAVSAALGQLENTSELPTHYPRAEDNKKGDSI